MGNDDVSSSETLPLDTHTGTLLYQITDLRLKKWNKFKVCMKRLKVNLY